MLQLREKQGNVRHLDVRRNLIDFASNDYLGLARFPFACTKRGSTGSRLLTGNSEEAMKLEESIARFHGYETGLMFNCGYMANVGLLSAIPEAGDIIIYDAHIHASTLDGIRLSKAKAFPFRHNDLQHLTKRLQIAGKKYICVESVYSTDGSQAPLRELCELAKQYQALLIVDEAHAVGVFGPEGRGLVAEYGLCNAVFAQIVTFGKALGAFGAIILGSSLLRKLLINFANAFIYTTALPYYALEAIHFSYEQFPKLHQERAQLHKLIKMFNSDSNSPIKSVSIPGNQAVKEASQQLSTKGFDVRALTSPTVRRGRECLRICLHAFNSEVEVQNLIKELI